MWLTALDQGSNVVARLKEAVLIITVIDDELSPFMIHRAVLLPFLKY